MATYTLEEDLIGLGDGQIVRDRRTGQLGLLVEVDDTEDAEIGYEDDGDDDTEDGWVAGDDDDDDDEVGARRRRGGGRKRRKSRRGGRQDRREDRREDRQERRAERREDVDQDDLVNRTLMGSQVATGATTLNIVITPQEDFWVDDITIGNGSLANTLVSMIRVGDVIVEDWPDGMNIADMLATLTTKRYFGQGAFCKGGLSIRITGTIPGAGTVKVNVHGKTPKKSACA